MEVVAAVASITTLIALAKEISTIAESLLRDFHNAPKELIQVSNQVALVFLELECINTMQQDSDFGYLLTEEETWILKQSLTIAVNNITAIHKECEKNIQAKNRLSSRISWALFDCKTVNTALDQLQRTEGHLLFVTQIINMKRSIRAHINNANSAALVLQELRTYHEEVRTRLPSSRSTVRPAIATTDVDTTTAFRHQYSFIISEYWRQLLGSDLCLTTSQNDFQAAYEFYARFPIFTFRGRMALALSLTIRRTWGLFPNISLFGGGMNFANVVPVDSEVIVACKKGDLLAVRDLFFHKKAAPNDMTVEDRTLIYYATQSGSVDLIRFLVNAGSPVRSKQLLAASWWRQPETARILLRSGVNVEMIGSDGRTAASYLFGSTRLKAPQTEFIEILACNSFSQFNAQDKDGWTVLHRAAAWGTAADVRKLLEMNASTNCRTHKLDWTPLFCAVCYKNYDTLQELWDSSDPTTKEQQDPRGWNLLHIAAGYGNFEAVPYLLERGVSLEAVSKPTSRFVPPYTRGKCVTPGEVARSCGKDAYIKWNEALRVAGREVDLHLDEISWASEAGDGRLGECECCDNWNASPSSC